MADKIDNDRGDFGTIGSFQAAEEFRAGLDFLSLVIPVGEVVAIIVGIPGVPTPDPNIFQECDGSEIVNPGSPLRSIGDDFRFVPDMRDRYAKIPQIFGQSGQAGGKNNLNILRHDHGGITGDYVTPEGADVSNETREPAFRHRHEIDYSFDDGPINVEPPYYTLKWFMRIQQELSMIVTPPIFTPTHIEEITRGGATEPFNEETITKLIQNQNWALDLRPIGTIILHNINQPDSTPPDPEVYQQCDGSEITNPDSPLRSIGINQNFVPDLRDRYIQVHNQQTGNPLTGSQEHSLRHDHSVGGRININPQTGIEEDDKDDRRYTPSSHSHDMATQYPNPTIFDAPAFVYYVAYMKIV